MMCIIYAGKDMTQDTAVRLEFRFFFVTLSKLSDALTVPLSFQVQRQLHPSAPRGKWVFCLFVCIFLFFSFVLLLMSGTER